MRAFGLACLALLSHWRRHPVQAASIFIGLWLATALWTGVQALNAQARADYDRASATLTAPAHGDIRARQGQFIDEADYVALRRAGWPVSPILEGRLRLSGADGAPVTVDVIGIEPLTLPVDAAVAGQSARGFDFARFIGPPGEAWMAPDTLRRLGLADGDTMPGAAGRAPSHPVAAPGVPAPGEATVTPLAPSAEPARPRLVSQPALAPGVVVMDIGQAQALLGLPGAVSRLMLPQADADAQAAPSATPDAQAPPATSPQPGTPSDAGSSPGAMTPAWPGDLGKRLRLQAADDSGDLRRLTDSFHLNLTALALLAFVVGLFIVNAAIGLALEQRRPLLRTLRACGVGLRVLIAALVLELGVFAVLGGLAGVASGYGLAGLLLPDVATSLRGLYGADIAGQLQLAPSWWLAGLGMAILGAVAAGASSLWRAARLPILAVAQPQAWRGAQSRLARRQAIVAVVLFGVSAACWAWGNSLASAFGMIGSLLLAAALVLPVILDAVLAGLARLCRRPLSEWFVADSRQQLPALALALMALLLALSASVGVGSMTEGFRQTFLGWLDQRLSADLYVTPRDSAQGEGIAQWLEAQPGVDAVLPQWRAESQLQGWPLQVVGVRDDAGFARAWPLLSAEPGAWASLASGQGVMLSEQLTRRLGLALGQSIALPVGGADQPVRVVAVYADYGNPLGQALVNASWLRDRDPSARMAGLGVRMQPGAPAAPLLAAVEQRHAGDGARVQDQATLKRWSRDVFDRTFQATAALNSLTLGVAGMALFISLLTLGQSRLVQLAPLWALGVSRPRLAQLTLAQTLMLTGLTIVLAMPFGLVLAWCLVAVVNVQAFGWRLPLYVFPSQLVQLGLLGLATSLLAAAGPLWRLARRQPADLLRQFAQER